MEEASGCRAPLSESRRGGEGRKEGLPHSPHRRSQAEEMYVPCLAFQLETILSWPSAHQTAAKGALRDHKIAAIELRGAPLPTRTQLLMQGIPQPWKEGIPPNLTFCTAARGGEGFFQKLEVMNVKGSHTLRESAVQMV